MNFLRNLRSFEQSRGLLTTIDAAAVGRVACLTY